MQEGIYVLSLRKIADPERRSTQERISQAPETQRLNPDACLPRHAGIIDNRLIFSNLQDTLFGQYHSHAVYDSQTIARSPNLLVRRLSLAAGRT